jgi:hypothetical protein
MKWQMFVGKQITPKLLGTLIKNSSGEEVWWQFEPSGNK